MRNHMVRLVRRQREQVNGEQEPLLWFLLVRQVSRLNMASLNNFSGLWVIGDVPSCLVPGPGVIREVDSGPKSDSPVEEISSNWGYAFQLVDLLLKGMLTGELLTLSRERKTLGGAVPPVSPRPQMSKHENYLMGLP